MKRGVHGSVLIHFKDGEVSGVTDQSVYNPEAFLRQVDLQIKRYIVKSKPDILDEVVSKVSQTDEIVSQTVQDEEKTALNVATNEDVKGKNEK